MAEDPRAKYGLSCPSGGSFYICAATAVRFIGCCDHDPCTGGADGECEGDALHPASFSSTNYVDIPAQNCTEPYDGSTWWTCKYATPPFLGCCKSNPCNEGCSDADLLPARLSDDETNAAPFLTTASEPTSSPSSAPGPTSSSVPTQSPDANTSDPAAAGAESHTGLIVGVSMGGLVLLFAAIAVFLWRRRRKEKEPPTYNEDGVQSQPQPPGAGDQPGMMEEHYSPYKSSYPSTVHSSPYTYQASAGMVSPPMSTASTCWSPRESGVSHSRHTSQISELSGDEWIRELPEGPGLQTVPEVESGSRPPEEGRRGEDPPGEGTAHTPRGDAGNASRQYHELDAGN